MNPTESSAQPPERDRGTPRVWLLAGHKAGDNNQLKALAEALDWPYEVKSISYRRHELLTNRLLGATLLGINRRRSSKLSPPWPDLVLTAGRRNEPVARWIQRQSDGRARLVHLGRPWAGLDCFDLIITTPQYFLPVRTNILHNRLPLHSVNHERLNRAAREWTPRFGHLPRPWIGVLIGGDSGSFVMTTERGRELGRRISELAAAAGGAVLATDSARTPAAAGDAFVAAIDVPHLCHRWAAGGDNPYLGILACADTLVVTGESMSMLTEAAATGKPLYIYDFSEPAESWWRRRHNWRFRVLSDRLAMRYGPVRMRRDIGNIQHALVADGRAAWLGDTVQPRGAGTANLDLERAVQRVRELFE